MDIPRGPAIDRFTDGLCGSCRHARVIVNDRGSRFVLCRRSIDDDRFRRYPPLPVVACVGFEATGEESTDRGFDPA